MTVLKVEVADIAFAVDSIMAAVALAITLPETPLPNIGGLDGGKFLVIFCGGFIGLLIIRFAATIFVKLLQRKPGLETAAYLIVGWVGVKLAVFALAHPKLAVLPANVPETTEFKLIFWTVLIILALSGWFLTKEKKEEHALN
jgi:YkoY family integral membrane protein